MRLSGLDRAISLTSLTVSDWRTSWSDALVRAELGAKHNGQIADAREQFAGDRFHRHIIFDSRFPIRMRRA